MNETPTSNGIPLTHRPFAKALTEARKAERLTQAALADLVGGSVKLIGHLERGEHRPSIETHAKLLELMPTLATAQKPRGMRKQRKRRAVIVATPPVIEAPSKTPAMVGGGYAGAIAEVKAAKKGIANLEDSVKKAKERLRLAIVRADAEHRKMLAAMTGDAS